MLCSPVLHLLEHALDVVSQLGDILWISPSLGPSSSDTAIHLSCPDTLLWGALISLVHGYLKYEAPF